MATSFYSKRRTLRHLPTTLTVFLTVTLFNEQNIYSHRNTNSANFNNRQTTTKLTWPWRVWQRRRQSSADICLPCATNLVVHWRSTKQPHRHKNSWCKSFPGTYKNSGYWKSPLPRVEPCVTRTSSFKTKKRAPRRILRVTIQKPLHQRMQN